MFYLVSMKTKENGQSLDSQAIEDMPVEKLAEWLKKDVQVASSLLAALLTDKDLLIHMATFMQGRYLNYRNQEKLKSEGLE